MRHWALLLFLCTLLLCSMVLPAQPVAAHGLWLSSQFFFYATDCTLEANRPNMLCTTTGLDLYQPDTTSGLYIPIGTGASSSSGIAGGMLISGSCATETVSKLLCWNGVDTDLYCGTDALDSYTICGQVPRQTLQDVFDQGNTITDATALRPFTVGLTGYGDRICYTDQTTGPICQYRDGSATPITAADIVYEGYPKYLIHHTSGGDFTCETRSDSTMAVTYASYQSCRPVKSLYIPAGNMSMSGCTNTAPTEETIIASGPKTYTIELIDNDACSVEFDFVMPDSWDGGTLTIEQQVYCSANANNDVLELDYACRCVRSGDQVAAHSTTGEQAATCTFGNQANDERHCTSAAITLNGTCAAGAHVYCRGQVDATATTVTAQAMTTKRLLGVKVEYTVTTNTDN